MTKDSFIGEGSVAQVALYVTSLDTKPNSLFPFPFTHLDSHPHHQTTEKERGSCDCVWETSRENPVPIYLSSLLLGFLFLFYSSPVRFHRLLPESKQNPILYPPNFFRLRSCSSYASIKMDSSITHLLKIESLPLKHCESA